MSVSYFFGSKFYRKSDVRATEEEEKRQKSSDCLKLELSSLADPQLVSYVAVELIILCFCISKTY